MSSYIFSLRKEILFSDQQVRIPVTGEAGLVFFEHFPAMGQAVTVPTENRLRGMQTLVTVCTAQCPVVGSCMLEIFNNINMARLAE
jgi:hypothetical protein